MAANLPASIPMARRMVSKDPMPMKTLRHLVGKQSVIMIINLGRIKLK